MTKKRAFMCKRGTHVYDYNKHPKKSNIAEDKEVTNHVNWIMNYIILSNTSVLEIPINENVRLHLIQTLLTRKRRIRNGRAHEFFPVEEILLTTSSSSLS